MSDVKHPLIEQAYQSAEDCYAEANATIDFLDQAMKALQEERPEVREALSQSFIKADQLIDHCGEIVEELQQLRLKYCAARSTSGLSPDLDLLKETLAGIEQRRQARRQSRVYELVVGEPTWQAGQRERPACDTIQIRRALARVKVGTRFSASVGGGVGLVRMPFSPD